MQSIDKVLCTTKMIKCEKDERRRPMNRTNYEIAYSFYCELFGIEVIEQTMATNRN